MKTNIIQVEEVGKGYYKSQEGGIFLAIEDGYLQDEEVGDLYIIAERDAETERVTAIKPAVM